MISVDKVDANTAIPFILSNHYSPVMPRLTKIYLGAFYRDQLVGVVTLGWGTQPLHTIKKLFSFLETDDYFEIGKMCMSDEMPRNSESQFLSGVVKWMKKETPWVRFLFSWADGMIGKPGYVYQASNFYYGGCIWTDTYITSNGEKVHPRTFQSYLGHRPTVSYLQDNRIRHIRGKQFRYIYPLNRTAFKNLSSSTVKWSRNSLSYPKEFSLEWKENTKHGWIYLNEMPDFDTHSVDLNISNVEKSWRLAA